jgi:WD40 repeat protein
VTAANCFAYAPDGGFVVVDKFLGSGRADTLGSWDAKTGAGRVLFEKSHSSWERAAVSPDGKKVAAVSVGQMELKVWDAATGKLLETLPLPKWRGSALNAFFLAFTPDGGTLYSTFDKQVLEAKLGGKARLLDGLDVEAPGLTAFDPPTRRLIRVRNAPRKKQTELLVADLAGGEPKTVRLDTRAEAIALSPDGKTLAISFGGVPGKARLELWDADGWTRRATLAADPRPGFAGYRLLAFAPDGKGLAGAPAFEDPRGKGAVTFLDADGKVTAEGAAGSAATQLAFSPDGKTLAVRLLDNKRTLVFLDPATGAEKKP